MSLPQGGSYKSCKLFPHMSFPPLINHLFIFISAQQSKYSYISDLVKR